MENENLKIVDKLNDHLAKQDKQNKSSLEGKYQFIYSQSPNGFRIEFQEIYETGQTFLVFDSNESIPESIEELYEKDVFSYEEMVIKVIQHNIRLHIENLKEIYAKTFSL
jgi:hypothetical protein